MRYGEIFKKNYFFSYGFFLSVNISFALSAPQPANCTFTIIKNWTETLRYKCAQDVNLNGALIQFNVDKPAGLTNLDSVWGFSNIPVYPTNPVLKLNGQQVSLALNFSTNPVTLKAGVLTDFSFSTNNNVVVVNPVLYQSGTTPGDGILTLSLATGSDALPIDTTVHLVGQNTSFSTDIVYANQQQLNQIPYGTYLVSVSASEKGTPVVVQVVPNQLTFDSTHKNLSVALSYTSTAASLNIAFPVEKPSDVLISGVTLHVIDPSKTDHPILIPWNGQANLSGLVAGTTYTLNADQVTGQKNSYSFTLTPSSFQAKAGQNSASMSMQTTPIVTGVVNVTVSGLPADQATTLNFTYKDSTGATQNISFNNVKNGQQSFNLPAGFVYNVSAQMVISGGFKYTTTTNIITVGTTIPVSTSFTFTKYAISGVNGWPAYIAMGAVTDDSDSAGTSLKSRPVDAIFKYAGMGGNGDPGQIIYPIFTKKTAEQAQALTSYYQQKGLSNIVKPVMVVYTSQMSGGTSFTDFEFDTLTKHFITLIMEAQTLQQYKTDANPYPGAIVLNPDLFGMVQQMSLIPALNKTISTVSLQKALQIAVCFATHTISNTYGLNLTYDALYKAIRNKSTDDWTAMSIWDQYKMQYYSFCTSTPIVPPTISIPTFTNDFPGWIQINNWIIRQFAPNVTFGWQENLWSIGSANWVHKNYTAATLKSTIADPTAATIMATTAYSGSYVPDFLAFDKYEMDALPGATGVGYLYNARDWNNVLSYVGDISSSLGNIPVMLWQIPGGHLQVLNDIDPRNSNGSTEPNYFFGGIQNPLSNLKSYITSLTLSSSIYGMTQITPYLSMDESGTLGIYTWTTSHLQQAANNHVFAILWGGGSTTSVSSLPSDDGGYLANAIMNYYQSPVPVGNFKRKFYH